VTGWETFDHPQTNVAYAVFEYNDVVYRGGWFSLFRWDGSQWQTFGGGIGGDLGTLFVADFRIYENVLVLGGYFPTAGGTTVYSIATWDGAAFGPVGGGVDGEIRALVVYNGDLIAGGSFDYAGGTLAHNIARWDGSAWYPLVSGVSDSIPDGTTDGVWDMVVWQGDLYVVGDFTHAGGGQVFYVARWDGSTWSDVGGGVSMIDGGPTGLRGVDVHDGDLVIVGCMDFAGGVEATNIARWDGVVWSPIGSGSDPYDDMWGWRQAAHSVASYRGLLYVGADFSEAVGEAAACLAVWDGVSWEAVDNGLEGERWPIGPYVGDLEVAGEGITTSLLMGGNFKEANAEDTDMVARYTNCSGPTGVPIDNTPKPFRVASVSPNPFNPWTTVRFTLPAAMPVTAEIRSVTGARVRLLAKEKPFGPGDHQLTWDGRTDQGSPAASGVYFIRLKTRLGAKMTRAVLLK
jgi:hypothetical protein